uniref:RBR-type E3 ubiquitin transferase n=1 Tax=Hordeum vulgare subsp. vulgare TaxID=112509 RepID=A0A8I6XFK3_HORVV
MACAAEELDVQDLRLQELIRGSMPDRPPSSSSFRVPPLSDDEIGWFHCAVCMEPKLAFDRFGATAACAHEFCVACVVAHIESRVADGAVPVPCLAAGCPVAMHPEACKKLLHMDVFDAWCVALCERALGPGRARCPYRDCGQLVVLDAGCSAPVGLGVRIGDLPRLLARVLRAVRGALGRPPRRRPRVRARPARRGAQVDALPVLPRHDRQDRRVQEHAVQVNCTPTY